MPMYEFACQQCGQTFEELVSGDEHPACPQCGSAKTEKLLSCCAFSSGGASSGAESDYTPPSTSSGCGGGCAGCAGGHCASCGH